MNLKCLWMLLVLSVPAPAFSQQDPTTASSEPRLIVEAVECRGNQTIPCDFIRRKLHLPANSEVDGEAVQSAQLRLSALPNFESVRVYLEKGSEKGKTLLIVEVVEADALITEVALGLRYVAFDPPSRNVYIPLGPYNQELLISAIAGRLSNQNLFGRQKIAELAIGGKFGTSFAGKDSNGYAPQYSDIDSGRNHSGYSAAVIYIDPNLFGSDLWFASVSAGYTSDRTHWTQQATFGNPNSVKFASFWELDSTTEQAVGGLAVGYRLWDYSYLYGRLNYNTAQLESNNYQLALSSDNSQNYYFNYHHQSHLDTSQWLVGYGWDSEDDAYFPTRGLRFAATVSECSRCGELNWRLAYKQTWMMGSKSLWTLNVGGEPDAPGDRLRPIQSMTQSGVNASIPQDAFYQGGLAVTYSHLLSPAETLGGIRRGRWYIKLGTGPVDISTNGFEYGNTGEYLDQAHLTFGLRFESKVLGVVDLFAAGSYFWPQWR